MLHVLILIATHVATLVLGFLIGVYVLPILAAPKGPDVAALQATAAGALYKGRFERNLRGSDFLHWGEGEVRVLPDRIAHEGRLAPGPGNVNRRGDRCHGRAGVGAVPPPVD